MAVEMIVVWWFEVLANVLEESDSVFFVFRVLMKSRLCGVIFEAWVSEIDEPMLNV